MEREIFTLDIFVEGREDEAIVVAYKMPHIPARLLVTFEKVPDMDSS
jgi:hypothetical protein